MFIKLTGVTKNQELWLNTDMIEQIVRPEALDHNEQGGTAKDMYPDCRAALKTATNFVLVTESPEEILAVIQPNYVRA